VIAIDVLFDNYIIAVRLTKSEKVCNIIFILVIHIGIIVMQERDIRLLFDSGVLRACIVVPSPVGAGFNVLFAKKGEIKPVLSLDTRPRKAGDSIEIRRFKTVDSACSLVKRQIGFKTFVVEL